MGQETAGYTQQNGIKKEKEVQCIVKSQDSFAFDLY